MADENKVTPIKDLGEFGLIDRISNTLKYRQPTTVMGAGDDAAVIDKGDHFMLFSSDMLVENIHFDLVFSPLQHVGYKAVSVNVSDIAAMNGTPQQVTINLGLSSKISVEAVDVLYSGINQAAEDFNVDVVGGDITSSASGLVISVAAVGVVEKEKLVKRSGAKLNDILCVTGDLGGAFMGLNVLEREKKVFQQNPEMQPDLQKYEYIVKRSLKPAARTDIIFELNDLGVVPTSMIDVSDGLASEILHLGINSGVGINIHDEQLPIDKSTYDTAVEFELDPTTCALNGGDDYELLFTIDQNDHEKLKKHSDIHFIGYVQEGSSCNLITKNENVVPLKAQGWAHFRE